MNAQNNDSNTTIDDIKKEIEAYRNERGWNNLKPRDLAISIVLEASELLEHFQWEDGADIETKRDKIMNEFGDTLNYLFQFAMEMDFDITTAWREKLELVKAKYPTSVFNPSQGHNLEAYDKIKASYRGENTDNAK